MAAHAEAYKDPGTPEEQTRRTFMANAVVALGGVIGLGIAIPLIASLVPPNDANVSEWSPLTPDEVAQLKKATDKPVKVTFMLHETNGYFGATDQEQFFWAIKADEAKLRAKRPELFGGVEKVPYPVVNLGFKTFEFTSGWSLYPFLAFCYFIGIVLALHHGAVMERQRLAAVEQPA